MPFEQTCPGCGATFELADTLAGKSLRCQECDRVFVGTPPKTDDDDKPRPVKTPKRKRTEAPARQSSGFSVVTAILGVVIVMFGLTCGISVVLIAASFITTSNPKPLANQDTKNDAIAKNRKDDAIAKDRKDDAIAKDHDKNLDKGGPKGNDAPPVNKVENPPQIVAQPMPLDAQGRASFNANANENKGAVSYRVSLQKGRAYNFFAESADFEPHVKISLDDRVLEAKQGTKSCFVSVTPEQSAEHTVTISARPRESGSFSFQFAPAESRPLVKIDASRTSAGYNTKDDLRIQHETSPRWPNGPHRSFRMDVVAGNEYAFKIHSTQFKPVLRLLKGEGTLGDWVTDVNSNTLDAMYKAEFTGEVIVFISTERGLGDYSLNIKVLPDRPPVPAAGRRIEFKGDEFKQVAEMDKVAPRNDKGAPYVVYDFPMEAGWAYSITHKHTTGDCGLVLFGPAGQQIAATNRFANTHSVRILHDATVTGMHRLHASVADAGLQSYTLEVTRFKLPAPQAVNTKLASRSKQVAGLAITDVNVSQGFIRSYACDWSRDGTKLFVFDESGWLHRYRMPEFFEEQKLFLDKDGLHEMFMTSEGIVIARTKLREFWLIDPDAMRIVRRVPTIYGAMMDRGAVLTGRDSSVAYTQMTGSIWDGPLMKGVAEYDLTGKTAMVGMAPNRLTKLLALSADGKTVFGKTDDGKLGRWRVVNKSMVFDEAGDWYGPSPSVNPLNLSADGKYLFRTIMPVKAARVETQSVPPSGSGALVYAVNDLSKPAFLIDTGSTAYTVASDPKTGKIYTYSDARGLLVADRAGKVEQVPLPIENQINDRIRSIFFHPDGGKFVALVGNTNGRVAYVELKNAAGDDKKQQVFNGWGTVTDPDGDCTVTEDKGKLTVKVPGSLHDLFPLQKDEKKRMNAPRVLQEVKGDFVATLKVTAEWKPGDALPGSSTVPYNGAGLLVWENENNFIRLERNVFVRNVPVSCTTPYQFQGGNQVNSAKTTEDEFFKGKSTWLKVERLGEQITTSISHDGKEWTETAKLRANYPETVRVGALAVNSSDNDFVVEFAEFKITVKK